MADQKTKQPVSLRKRKYWIGCNWKCNGSVEFIKDSVKNMINDVSFNSNHLGKLTSIAQSLDFIIMPGMLHLPLVQALLKDGISVGAQNCSATAEGAFTGEVSSDHLIDYRIDNVMIGHNERRKIFNESQEIINEKIKQAWDCNLNVVYCVGENAE